jgi:hypothetical protein
MIECNFTPWASGNNGLGWWNTSSLSLHPVEALLILSLSSLAYDTLKIFIFFIFFYRAFFTSKILVKNKR